MGGFLFLALGLGAAVVVVLGRLTSSVILRRLSGALGFLSVAALAQWGVGVAGLPDRWSEIANVVLLLSLGIVVARAALVLLFDVLLHRQVGLQVPRLARDVLAFAVYLVVTFAILHSVLGLELSTLLATSAVVSVVVGLALQESLGTLLAGLALTSERRIAPGTWIEVGGVLGEVEELGWRSLVLRTPTRERILLPNSDATRTRIRVLGEGREPVAVRVRLGVSYGAPPPAVREVLARAAGDIPEVLTDPAPRIYLEELADSAITYDCWLWTRTPWRVPFLKDAFLTRAVAGLGRAGFDIPFPQRTVHIVPGEPAGEATAGTGQALAACELFAGLPQDALEALAGAARLLTYFPDECVVRKDEVSRALYVVVSGDAAVDVDGQVVGRISAGDVFGEMAFLSGEPRAATVRADGTLQVVEVDAQALTAFLHSHPELAEELARRMAARQQQLQAQAEALRAASEQTSLTGLIKEKLLKLLTR